METPTGLTTDVEESHLLGLYKNNNKGKKKKYIGIVTFILIPIVICLLVVFGVSISLLVILQSLNQRGSEIKFIAWGDWGREGHFYQDAVAGMMNRWCNEIHECDFIVSTGDNFYPSGVKNADSEDFKKSFEDIYLSDAQTHLKDKQYYVTLGNHDYKSNPAAQTDYGKLHSNWILPKPYYERDIKSRNGDNQLRILFVDTVPLIERYYEDNGSINQTAIKEQSKQDQLQWFDDALDRATKENIFTVVVGHHPLHALTNKNLTELTDLQNSLERLMAQYHVSLFIAGHVHNLQYSSVEKDDYAIYNVLSGAGSKIVDIPKKGEVNMAVELEYNKFKFAEGGFVGIELNSNGNMLDIQYISHDYTQLYKRSFQFDASANDKTRYREIK